MSTRVLWIFFSVLLLAVPVASQGVDISVEEQVDAEIQIPEMEINSDRPSTWRVEAHNTGSVPMTGQIRLDIRQDDRVVSRTWSDEFVVNPGAAVDRALSFYDPSIRDEVEAQAVLHYGVQQETTAPQQFTVQNRSTEEGFVVSKARLYRDRLHVGIDVPEGVHELHIWAGDRSTRRFEQEIISDPATTSFVDIPFSPAIQEERTIQLAIADGEGQYHSTVELEEQPLDGFEAWFYATWDALIE